MDRLFDKRIHSVCLSLGLVILLPFLAIAAINDQSSADFYISEYGVIPPSYNRTVEYAHQVFNRLVISEYADDAPDLRLIILPKSAANWVNWAMSLPDGTVVLVENVLDLCFAGKATPGEEELAKLAFILSHEITHLTEHHHQQLDQKNALHFHDPAEGDSWSFRKHLESKADYAGILRMTMAGYDPGHLLDGSNFFDKYIENVRIPTRFRGHEKPVKRFATLKQQLNPLIEKIPLFAEGIRFYENREYKKAILRLQEFSKVYPGREVFNNLGLCYYQLALKELSQTHGNELFRFMYSTAIDEKTLAVKLLPEDLGAPKNLPSQFQLYLKKAVDNLHQAVKQDPEYLPAKINLTSAYLLLKSYQKALEVLDEILKKDPSNIAALNNKAIVLYLVNPDRNHELALKMLTLLSARSGHFARRYAAYNASRIRFEQMNCAIGDFDLISKDCLRIARKSWSGFLNNNPESPYAHYIRKQLGEEKRSFESGEEKDRLALVIGNGLYPRQPLLNAQNDALAMEDVLKELGFEVITGLNLSKPELLAKIRAFGQRLTPQTTGFVFYSGHGFQINGENFLLPVYKGLDLSQLSEDVAMSEQALRDLAVSLTVVLDKMQEAKNIQNIVVLDACRVNPLPGLESKHQGFAEMSAPQRTFMAYSTSPGALAWDGLKGQHGVFTDALLKRIAQPKLDIHELFQSVRKEVLDNTSGYQVSWDVSTLNESYYFNPPKDQDWKWHITAATVAVLAGWQAREEARNYRKLNDENELLWQSYGSAINLIEYYDIRQAYYINQEKMKTHKRNYELLDIVTLGAVLWEIYLLAFETYDEGVYSPVNTNSTPKFTLYPIQRPNNYGFTMQWQW